MKKIVSLLLILAFFASCSQKTEEMVWKNATTKPDFMLELQSFDSFWKNAEIKKVWKVDGSQDLKILSQALWKISKIHVKEWQKVLAWQTLISLTDSIANYWINLERALNSLDRSKINYDSTQLTLDKQVFDSEIALEKLNSSYEALKKNALLDINQAKDNLQNSEYETLDSKSALQLAQLDNAIEKSELDFSNKIISDNETLEGFNTTYKKEYNSMLVFLWDIIEFWDKLFWVTNKYDDEADKYNDYLGWKDILIKDTTKQNLTDLIAYKSWNLAQIDINTVKNDTLIKNITTINEWYELSKKYLNNFEETFNQSITSIWVLSQAEVTAYVAAINAYQAQLQWNYSAFIAYDNTVTSFLRTYKNAQESLAKQIDLQKKDRDIVKKTLESSQMQFQTGYDKTITSSEDSIKALELQIKTAKNNLENAIQGRDITLKSLKNAIRESEIAYESAGKEYSKLTITAPISWIIGDIMIDVWADVANGTPLVTLIGTNNTEVEVAFTKDEIDYAMAWNPIYAYIGGKTLTGVIYSISSISDDSLNYKVLSTFEEKIQNLGWVVDVTLPIKSNSILIPLKNVALIWTNKWIIHIYENEKIVQKEVLLWKMYKDNIEFLEFLDGTKVDTNTLLVLTDVSNYDENKFQLKIKQ